MITWPGSIVSACFLHSPQPPHSYSILCKQITKCSPLKEKEGDYAPPPGGGSSCLRISLQKNSVRKISLFPPTLKFILFTYSHSFGFQAIPITPYSMFKYFWCVHVIIVWKLPFKHKNTPYNCIHENKTTAFKCKVISKCVLYHRTKYKICI